MRLEVESGHYPNLKELLHAFDDFRGGGDIWDGSFDISGSDNTIKVSFHNSFANYFLNHIAPEPEDTTRLLVLSRSAGLDVSLCQNLDRMNKEYQTERTRLANAMDLDMKHVMMWLHCQKLCRQKPELLWCAINAVEERHLTAMASLAALLSQIDQVSLLALFRGRELLKRLSVEPGEPGLHA